MRRQHSIHLAGLAVVLLAGAADAAPVAIVNAGFEDLYGGIDVPATAFPAGNNGAAAPNGWDAYGAVGGDAYIGVLNPGTVFFVSGASEGDNAALAYYDDNGGGAEFGIEQTLAATLAAGTLYTLQVDIGNIRSGTAQVAPWDGLGEYDLTGFPGYRVELRAGGEVLASDVSTLLPGEGEFLTSTIQASVAAGHVALGANLVIRLVNLNLPTGATAATRGLEVDFDNVRLDAAPVPLPAAAWMLLAPLVLLARPRRRAA
ncbi:MAG: hypothetical protein KDK06_11340 [Gammaproteobacteria bacterium]|nr:hypothetical protein [Gammaproteobacteria bacterium]